MAYSVKTREELIQELEAAHARLAELERTVGESNVPEPVLRALLDATVDAAAILITPQGDVLAANEAFATAFNLDPEEVTRHNVFDLVPPPVAQQRRQHVAEVIASRKPLWFTDERSGRRIANSLYPVVNEQGAVTRLAIYARHVTEEEQQLAELQQYRERLEERVEQRTADLLENQRVLITLMSNLPGMAYRCKNNPQWTMLFVSRGCMALTGYPPSALLGNRDVAFTELIHEDDRQAVWADTQRALERRKPFQLEYRLITAEGVEKWVWEQGQGVWSREGELQAVEGFITDITGRKHAEVALQESEQRYRALFEGANDAVFIIALDGRVLAVNQRAADMLGYTRDELLNMTIEQGVPEGEHEQSQHVLEALLADETVPIYERSFRHKDGHLVPVEINAVLVRNQNGDPLHIQSIARDITERKRYVKRLEGLRELDRAILVNRSPETIAQGALNYLRKLIPCRRATVSVIDYEAREFWLVADSLEGGEKSTLGKRWSLDRNPQVFAALQHASTHTIPNIEQIAKPSAVLRDAARHGIRSCTSLALIAHGELIGVLSIGLAHPGGLPPTDLEIAQEVANQLAVAIFQSLLSEAERKQRVLVQALYDTATALNSTLDIDEILDRILTSVERVLPHDGANIMLLDDKDEVRIARVRGYGDVPEVTEVISRLHLKISERAFLDTMRRTQEPLVIGETHCSEYWRGVPDTDWMHSYVGAPIHMHGQIFGYINLDSSVPRAFTDEHARHLKAFADQAAIAISNARLFEELQNYSHSLVQAVEERTAELRQAKEHAETILHNSPTATLLLKPDGIIQTGNPAFCALFELDENSVSDRLVTDLVTRADSAKLLDALRAATHGRSASSVALTARRVDGSTFDAEVMLAPVQQEGELLGVVCNIGNISAFKEVERMKDEFISTAAHELRTPLTSVQGFSEILLTRALDDERRNRYLEMINQQAEELAHIIDELLDISRLQSDTKMNVKQEAVDMHALLMDTLETFSDVSPWHSFRLAAPAQMPQVVGDAFRLAQVLRNLVSNAVKYSPGGGEVVIRCAHDGKRLSVSVKDEGIGMTPEEQSHLFEKFYRARSVSTISGTGLGLVISQLIIQAHGGDIAVQSEHGVGTTVTFTLPVAG